jgi:hypothetical protein
VSNVLKLFTTIIDATTIPVMTLIITTLLIMKILITLNMGGALLIMTLLIADFT